MQAPSSQTLVSEDKLVAAVAAAEINCAAGHVQQAVARRDSMAASANSPKRRKTCRKIRRLRRAGGPQSSGGLRGQTKDECTVHPIEHPHPYFKCMYTLSVDDVWAHCSCLPAKRTYTSPLFPLHLMLQRAGSDLPHRRTFQPTFLSIKILSIPSLLAARRSWRERR